MSTFAAVDLGASSGRVMVARVGPERLELSEAHRFPNLPVRVAGTLHWDVLALYREILAGLRLAVSRFGPLSGIGVLRCVSLTGRRRDTPPVSYRVSVFG